LRPRCGIMGRLDSTSGGVTVIAIPMRSGRWRLERSYRASFIVRQAFEDEQALNECLERGYRKT
jgi:hypothetical protein